MRSILLAFIAAGVVALICTPSSAVDALQIGVGAPLTGIDSVFGSQLKLGVEEAVNDINAEGGFLGTPGQVIFEDDASDPKKGTEVAKRFANSGVKIVIGHFSSAVTVPASAIYAESKILDITPTAEAPIVTDRGFSTIFRMCGREDQQAAVATRFLTDRHYSKIAILHDRTSAGKKLADEVRKALSDHGIENVYFGSVAEGARDVGAIASRVKAAGSQIVVWGGGPQGAGQIAHQLRDTHIPLLGGIGMASDDFANTAGSAADGTFIVFPRDPRRRPAASALLGKLKSKNIDPDGFTFYAYAAVQVIRQAAESANSLDPEKLAEAMHADQRFQTVIGPITFNRNGDPDVSDLTVYTWRKGPSGRMEFLDPASS